jgi:RND family efflux transporter MFP subunit
MKIAKTITALLVLTLAFASGYVLRATRSTSAAAKDRKVLYYVDPMHPAYKSDKPGIAPDCGMTLEPVYAKEPGPIDMRGGDAELGGSAPPGAIKISPERQQLIGVKFATAQFDDSARSIRTVGKVTYDETRVAHVHPRIEGWIEKVFVNFTGDLVEKGEPMLTIYSPEMLASQQELLLAARARDLMASNPLATAAQHGESLFEAAKRRLELWDLSPDQIQQVLTSGQPIRSITLHAPSGGFVLERKAFPNEKVTADTDLYTIADLSRVWIMADVFESDITGVRVGDAAHVAFPYQGMPSIAAKVNYIQPQVDPMTRTIKVRLDAANAKLSLKPEMFVNVEFGVPGPKRLTVPAEAVLDTGDRQTVFVDLGNGYLQPRQVEVGERLNDRIVIAKGLAEGERVVASGTFLIDSESQLKAAANGMGAPQHQHGGAATSQPSEPRTPSPTPSQPGAHRHD